MHDDARTRLRESCETIAALLLDVPPRRGEARGRKAKA